MENLQVYVSELANLLLCKGIQAQLDAFKTGFNEVFPIRQLKIYSPHELAVKLGGESELTWTLDELALAIAPQHGYDSESQVYVDFLRLLHNLITLPSTNVHLNPNLDHN